MTLIITRDGSQPVPMIPVWRAYAITDLSPQEFLALLTLLQQSGRAYLQAYRYSGDTEQPARRVSRKYYEEVLRSLPTDAPAHELIGRLPRDHYVNIDDLHQSFTAFNNDHPQHGQEGGENTGGFRVRMRYEADGLVPDTRYLRISDILAVPASAEPKTTGKRKPTEYRKKIEARNRAWRQEFKKRRQRLPEAISDFAIFGQIAKDKVLNPEDRSDWTVYWVVRGKSLATPKPPKTIKKTQ